MQLALNAIFYKLGWTSSVLGAANGMPWIGSIMVILAVVVHLRAARRPQSEALLIVISFLIGVCVDSTMLAMGWVSYMSPGPFGGLAPYWILGLWVLFATTLNVLFKALQRRLILAVILGAVFGPLSYLAGARIGAIEILNTTATLTSLSLAWAILMPTLLLVAARLDGITQKPTHSGILVEAR